MNLAQAVDLPTNGGFPEPPEGEPVRVVAARHPACGVKTRVRLPAAVPARAVRRLECSGCAQEFETADARETGRLPIDVPRRLRVDPQSRIFRLATVPVAAAAVIGGLLLIRGEDAANPSNDASVSAGGAAASEATRGGRPTGGGPAGDALAATGAGGAGAVEAAESETGAKLVRGSAYALALPAGWKRTEPAAGATFAAKATDSGADATLWVTRDPELDFPTFINQSLQQLRALAGSAEIVERIPAPTPEGTLVRLAANAPAGEPAYEVTLRAAGDYRYYLATTVAPDASEEARAGAELIVGSFTPSAEAGS